jgi:hypothetical protein
MAWEVEFAEQFGIWWDTLSTEEQESVAVGVGLLEQVGPSLSRPHVDTLKGSRFPNMKELRVQHDGRPLRILFAFDPRRVALLLLGGDKTGDKRWYDKAIPVADAIYGDHLKSLE